MTKGKIKESIGDRTFNTVVVILLIIVNILMLYPFIYVLSVSVSDPNSVIRGEVILLPKGFSKFAYEQILTYPLFTKAYLNTIFYASVGTVLTLLMTILAAYPLSMEKLRSRGVISFFYVFTMFFSGGMIPTFLVVKNLHLLDKRMAVIIVAILGAWNVIICRSFLQTIPKSLHESAYIDGANDWTILFRIILPLSKPVLSTIALFSIVGFWNDFFSALLYLNDRNKYPLQMILRNILINSEMIAKEPGAVRDVSNSTATMSLKTASIVVTIIPVLCVYPFIQKYFVKGVMIGSIKG